MMSANTTVIASFTQNEYALDITQATGGTITASPTGPYHWDDVVTLTATHDPGYSFSAWIGGCAGQGNPCLLTVDGSMNVSAIFTQDQYILTVISDHGEVSIVPENPYYTYGQTVVLTMGTVDNGWTFAGWSGGGCFGIDPCTVTMDGNKTVTAIFTQNEYSLDVSVDPSDSGNTVTRNNNGPYHLGDKVTLTPIPLIGWQFDYMTGAVCDEFGCSVTITGNMVVTAYFTRIEYTLTLLASPDVGGTITPDNPGPYYYNDVVTLTSSPAAGYSFDHWGDACSGNGTCMVTITGHESVTAYFAQNTYTIGVTIVGSGSVIKLPDQLTYTYGQVVNLSASAELGYTFTGWGETAVVMVIVRLPSTTTNRSRQLLP